MCKGHHAAPRASCGWSGEAAGRVLRELRSLKSASGRSLESSEENFYSCSRKSICRFASLTEIVEIPTMQEVIEEQEVPEARAEGN